MMEVCEGEVWGVGWCSNLKFFFDFVNGDLRFYNIFKYFEYYDVNVFNYR